MAKNSVLDYNATADNNTDIGGIGIQGTSAVNNFDNAFRTIMAQICDLTGGNMLASGTTTDLSMVPGQFVTVSGNSSISALGTARVGWTKKVRFTGTPTLVYNSTSLILPGAADISVSAGDTAIFVSEGSGNWRCTEYFSSFAKTILDDASGAAIFGTMGATYTSTSTSVDVKMPNGFILKAGLYSGAGTDPAITFPSAFPNRIIVPFATMLVAAPATTTYSVTIGTRSASGMQLYRRSISNGGAVAGTTEPFFWMGLGD